MSLSLSKRGTQRQRERDGDSGAACDSQVQAARARDPALSAAAHREEPPDPQEAANALREDGKADHLQPRASFRALASPHTTLDTHCGRCNANPHSRLARALSLCTVREKVLKDREVERAGSRGEGIQRTGSAARTSSCACQETNSARTAWIQRERRVSRHYTTQHNTRQHSTAQHNTTQHSTAQHSTTQHSTTQHNTTQDNATQHNT
eukprot:3941967-Rhodomonas_salina.2